MCVECPGPKSAERYRERMAEVSEKVAGHLESMEADEILSRSSQVEKIDTVACRTFGLDSPAAGSGALNLNVLTGGRAIVQINQKNDKGPKRENKFDAFAISFPALSPCAIVELQSVRSFTNSGSIRDDRCYRPPKLGDHNSVPGNNTDSSARDNYTGSSGHGSGSDSNDRGNNRPMSALVLNRPHKERPQGSARTGIS